MENAIHFLAYPLCIVCTSKEKRFFNSNSKRLPRVPIPGFSGFQTERTTWLFSRATRPPHSPLSAGVTVTMGLTGWMVRGGATESDTLPKFFSASFTSVSVTPCGCKGREKKKNHWTKLFVWCESWHDVPESDITQCKQFSQAFSSFTRTLSATMWVCVHVSRREAKVPQSHRPITVSLQSRLQWLWKEIKPTTAAGCVTHQKSTAFQRRDWSNVGGQHIWLKWTSAHKC